MKCVRIAIYAFDDDTNQIFYSAKTIIPFPDIDENKLLSVLRLAEDDVNYIKYKAY